MPLSHLPSLTPSIQAVLTPWVEGVRVEVMGDSIRLEREGLVMDLDNLGEGECGDYNPEDPDDTPYLRFSFYCRIDEALEHDQLQELQDSSYCTLIDARLDLPSRLAFASSIFREVFESLGPHPDVDAGVKRICESLSAINTSDLGGVAEALNAARSQDRLNEELPHRGEAEQKRGMRM